jgi:glycine/D-amino acid oxidase-like deaminating enzyme/nitrite reductase/ring-hydroxylating ferredoxin subunit
VREAMPQMEPRNPSLWIATSAETNFPSLESELRVDVAVLGGGITGITAAHLLKREGKSVALLEAKRIVHGVTGYTTAKLTVGHGLIYARLEKTFGREGATMYADSNRAGIERIARFVDEERLDCDFERTSNFVYTESPDGVQHLREEVEAARRCGVTAELTTETELPFPVAGAVRVDEQAQFHPRRYLLPLAASLPGDGSHVFELTRAHGVRRSDREYVVEADTGAVRARDVVVATHLPFLLRGFFFAKAHPSMSYAVSSPIEESAAPRGMYISSAQPTRSIRSTPGEDGRRVLIIGGEGHKPGVEADTEKRYRALERFLAERFQITSSAHRWSTHDYLPVDGLPYIGRLTRRSEHVYLATGFAKWGLAKGTAAAMLITDLIVGRPNPWTELYDASRLTPAASGKRFLQENGQVGLDFVRGRSKRRAGREQLDRLGRGDGTVARIGGKQIAAYRDENGVLYTLSATCTHLGCVVEWNTAERTWDCPCHGSRFSATGTPIEGPALSPLRPKPLAR